MLVRLSGSRALPVFEKVAVALPRSFFLGTGIIEQAAPAHRAYFERFEKLAVCVTEMIRRRVGPTYIFTLGLLMNACRGFVRCGRSARLSRLDDHYPQAFIVHGQRTFGIRLPARRDLAAGPPTKLAGGTGGLEMGVGMLRLSSLARGSRHHVVRTVSNITGGKHATFPAVATEGVSWFVK